MLTISEIFSSIQGEGVWIGTPTTFIRLAGCNLRCNWCDTAYAQDIRDTEAHVSDVDELEIGELLERCENYGNKHICITGGEPLLQSDTPPLVQLLLKKEYHVSVETNGTMSLDKLPQSDLLTISMDIKCPSSGEEGKTKMKNIDILKPKDQVKFIIADEEDYQYTKKIIRENTITCSIILTPVGGIDMTWLVEETLSDKLNIRVLPQLHKIIWGNIRMV